MKKLRIIMWDVEKSDWRKEPAHYDTPEEARAGRLLEDENQDRADGWAIQEVYFTCIIPFEPDLMKRSPWHPRESTGSFSTLACGAFDTIDEAHSWAKGHLGSEAIYTVRES